MGLQHFQSDETLRSNEALRAQRMTADEAASVIALWQQEQTELTGLTDRPAVPDVAEGLDITVEDVQRLLEAVRAQRLEAEQRLVQEQELAEAEMRLAEEERRLTEIQRQRTELRQEQIYQPRRAIPQRRAMPHARWHTAQPGDARLAKLAKIIFFSLLLGLFIAPLIYVIICSLFLVSH